MKVLRFTIKRGQCEHLIHNIQALIKHHDKNRTSVNENVSVNILEANDSIGFFKKMFGIKERVRIIVQIKKEQNGKEIKSLSEMQIRDKNSRDNG